jgi:cytosine/adenosine deaminase-related metal-dependent hydrolase
VNPTEQTIYEADAVVTGPGDVFAPGAVAVSGSRISDVGGAEAVGEPGATRRRFPGGVIIPGLINAHCHLDLSFLRQPVSFSGSFVWWLIKVGWHRGRATKEEVTTGAREALNALVSSGVTAVGDIATGPVSCRLLGEAGIGGVVYLETIGHREDRVRSERDRIEEFLRECPPAGRVEVGLSPHTPYTVGARLWAVLRDEFASRVGRFSVHVSEVLEEAAFLEGGWGPFRRFLGMANLLEKDWEPPGVSPLEYVDRFGFVRPGTSIVHGNFLTDSDIDLLAKRQEGGPVPVVHCPRSHRFFRRLVFPAAGLEEAGIPVALGTDSLASNESFDMLEELRVLVRECPGVSAARALRMGTVSGAAALGLSGVTGSLEAGKRADLAVVDVSGSPQSDPPEERVLHASSRCALTVAGGKVVFEGKPPGSGD